MYSIVDAPQQVESTLNTIDALIQQRIEEAFQRHQAVA